MGAPKKIDPQKKHRCRESKEEVKRVLYVSNGKKKFVWMTPNGRILKRKEVETV